MTTLILRLEDVRKPSFVDYVTMLLNGMFVALRYCMQSPTKEQRKVRRQFVSAVRQDGKYTTWVPMLIYFELNNRWRQACKRLHIPAGEPAEVNVLFRREWLLIAISLAVFCFALIWPPQQSAAMTIEQRTPEIHIVGTGNYEPAGPKNWLDGEAEANGFRKDALSGPLQYARDSGYEFAATHGRLKAMVSEGTLVELEETDSLRFNKVTRPYVLPVVAQFVYRLADQYYYGQKCGPLVLNGAARDIEFQTTLSNGSDKSVHPTGMAVDFKSTGMSPLCREWLEDTLLEIEAARRIDFTKELSPAHYHVTVATHEYERWLKARQHVGDTETDTLRTAMFYEGGSNETIDGYRAIGWSIRNRVRSKDFPNPIQAVVADGSYGKHNGGCQFSFMCDGKPEDRYELCRTASGKLSNYWRFRCDMRWEEVTMVAKAVMAETNDPTGGAVLYYATWMKPKPHWARSRVERRADGSSIRLTHGDFASKPAKIGNHYFGCSRYAGSDVCEGGVS